MKSMKFWVSMKSMKLNRYKKNNFSKKITFFNKICFIDI